MQTAKVVIGSNWGDEGKGLITDFLADSDTIVCRYNGGSQARHTVCRNGKRHVFQHFGSGTMRGATTYLSRFFIHNPIVYHQELIILRDLGFEPVVAVDPAGMVTSPFDMMINQMVEQARGNARHGSCGIGINETIKRHEAGFRLTIANLSDCRDLLHHIRAEWVPFRLLELGVVPSAEWADRLASDRILDGYIAHCDAYLANIGMGIDALPGSKLVFEGAQGLLLDEDHRFFPHVTHSHTGLKNVVALAAEMYISALEVTYVTRAYATRHGAGPFPGEVTNLHYEDATNVTNDWQGHLRFGHLDLDLLGESIEHDLSHAKLPVHTSLAVTCLDQVGDTVTFWHDGQRITAAREAFLDRLSGICPLGLTSYGPSAADITSIGRPEPQCHGGSR